MKCKSYAPVSGLARCEQLTCLVHSQPPDFLAFPDQIEKPQTREHSSQISRSPIPARQEDLDATCYDPYIVIYHTRSTLIHVYLLTHTIFSYSGQLLRITHSLI
eukprot:4128603-Pleurochrysis_carterae.AAC.1